MGDPLHPFGRHVQFSCLSLALERSGSRLASEEISFLPDRRDRASYAYGVECQKCKRPAVASLRRAQLAPR